MNPALRKYAEKTINDFIRTQKGYHCYQLDTAKLDDNNLMTMLSIVESRHIPKNVKRHLLDGMTIRLQPEHWEWAN